MIANISSTRNNFKVRIPINSRSFQLPEPDCAYFYMEGGEIASADNRNWLYIRILNTMYTVSVQ